jgi:hypothetical protein
VYRPMGAKIMVWVFTISCLTLLIILPYSFFYTNYWKRHRRYATCMNPCKRGAQYVACGQARNKGKSPHLAHRTTSKHGFYS